MCEWPLRRVGDLVEQRKDVVTLKPGVDYRTMGVRWYGKGAYDRGTGSTETIKAKRLWRAHEGDFVFNRIDTQNGAFDVVPSSLHGALVTNEFPTYSARPGTLSEKFLLLHFQQDSVQRAIGATRAGSEGRARWKEADFEAWTLALPPLPEQQRIVTVMSAVGAQIEALGTEVASASRILAQYLKAEFQTLDGPETPIIDLCAKVIGGIWGLPSGESEVDVLALGPRVYSFGTTTLLTKGSPLRSFTAKQVEGRLVRENDIILERSGGSPEQPVGRVVIADKVSAQSVPTDFQRLLRPDTAKIEARYLFWRLQSDWNTRETVKYSRRTTGITNLSVKDYIAREIAVPSRGEQVRVVAVAESIEATSHLLGAELAALRTVRAGLLSALLSQEITVDAAVDQFVKAA